MSWFLIDIGNTNLNLGIVKKGKLKLEERFTPPAFFRRLPSLIKKYNPQKALICSVVPAFSLKLRKILKRKGLKVLECGKEVNIPIKNLYKKPEEVGQDRLLSVYTANSLYKDVGCVIDLGTALTIDIISKRGGYLGGFIFPGIRLSLKSLLSECALLPKKLKLDFKRSFSYGQSTAECISSGIILGYAFLISKFIEYLKKKRRADFKVVVTGGDALLLRKIVEGVDYFEPKLLIKGLNILRKKIERERNI
ncbi:MAG: type III pantothenate kinase [Candidatus Omnitrophica bacterium]|nr:type III pantothenate kinase [Candidatus Omnitrophota bacterium]